MVTTVAFNDNERAMHARLKDLGLTERDFSKFVKKAYYDAVEALNIEKLTRRRIEEQTIKVR